MNKKDFIAYLNEFKNSKGLNRKCVSMIKLLIKKIPSMDDISFIQFIELMSMYCEDMNSKLENEFEKLIPNINDADSDDPQIQNFINSLKQSAGNLGISMKVAKYDPNTGNFVDESGNSLDLSPLEKYYNRENLNNQQIDDNDIKFIDRRALFCNITSSKFIINDSFMSYLQEIKNLHEPKRYNPFQEEYDENDNTSLGLTIGIKKSEPTDNLIITIIGGVNSYETFYFDEMDNGYGVMDNYDFKYFKDKTKDKMNGKYIFTLDKSKKYFIGTKVI